MEIKSIQNKKAAMEMSMGTMVTIVLLTLVLILGGYFIQKIFDSATTSIDTTDDAVKSRLRELLSSDENKKVVISPSRQLAIKKDEVGRGFGFAIRNNGESGTFSYSLDAIETDCSLNTEQAEDLIPNRREGEVNIPAGVIMEDAILIGFKFPENVPPCSIAYNLNIEKDGEIYASSIGIDLEILPS